MAHGETQKVTPIRGPAIDALDILVMIFQFDKKKKKKRIGTLFCFMEVLVVNRRVNSVQVKTSYFNRVGNGLGQLDCKLC